MIENCKAMGLNFDELGALFFSRACAFNAMDMEAIGVLVELNL
jgi:hypothetical protein